MSELLTACRQALQHVIDPELRLPLTELGMIGELRLLSATNSNQTTGAAKTATAPANGTAAGKKRSTAQTNTAQPGVACEILITIAGCPAREQITAETRQALQTVTGIDPGNVSVRTTPMSAAARANLVRLLQEKRGTTKQPAPGTLAGSAAARESASAHSPSYTRVIAVTSGKGGVGKSSITAALALALQERGLSVGIVDADIFGFSQPSLFGLSRDGDTVAPTRLENLIIPPVAHGIKLISIGMFLGGKDSRKTALSWRGPMLHRTIEQFLRDVWFGAVDVLLLDLPPGTGDVAISVGQLLPGAEVLVVTTPQTQAADVAVRSGIVARQTGQHVIGVIENMAELVTGAGETVNVFGTGGGEAAAARLTETAPAGEVVPLLGSIPLSPAFRAAADAGLPAQLLGVSPRDAEETVTECGRDREPDPAGTAIREIAERLLRLGGSRRTGRLDLAVTPVTQ